MTGRSCGMPATPGLIVFMPSAGTARAIRIAPEATTETTGWASTLPRIQPQTLDSPWLAWRRLPMIGTRPSLDLVAELGEHGGQHGHRAEHGDGDHEHRADRHRGEDGVAGDQHAGHRDQHGHAGDQHGLARGRRGELERGLVGAPGVALLHLAPEVEHRVVDADREADEQHDARGGVGHRDDLADRREQAERAHHGREAEQQRHAGGDQRAEGDDEDQQRDRQRERLGALEVLLELRVERLGGGGVAELLDAQLGMRLLGGGDGGQRGVDALLGLLHVARAP